MKQTAIYDLPTRIFHWFFAGSFLGAFFIAKFIDDESSTFSFHMLIGLFMLVTILFRIVWGFTGSRYARFKSFELHPKKLIDYMQSLFSGETKEYAGHNPASSWSALLMMGLGIGMAITGWAQVTGLGGEAAEEIHEFLAHAFLAVVSLHLVGLILHKSRHSDNLVFSMINGRKELTSEKGHISSNRIITGFAFAIVMLGVMIGLYRNYDPLKQELTLFGTSYQLGESEEHHGESHETEDHHDEDEDEEEDDD